MNTIHTQASSEPGQSTPLYDTIIVGAGLAGLSAAYDLRQNKQLVLEKNSYPGGRVFTGNDSGTCYELGSLFACRKDVLPFEMNTTPLLREDGPVGLYHNGATIYGDSGRACLLQSGITMQQLEQFFRSSAPTTPNSVSTLLNAFFRVIHPGNMADSVRQRWLDALIKFDTHHFERGNQEVIDAFARELPSEIILNTEVLAVEEQTDCVRITFRQAGQRKESFAKACVVSTPAPVAQTLLSSLNERCRNFLNALRYGEGTVVVIGCRNVEFHDFSYIVTPHCPINTIFKYRSPQKNINVLVAYYVAEQSSQAQTKEEGAILAQTLELLKHIHPYRGSITDENILFSKIHHWEHVGSVISPEAYGKWTPDCRRPSDRVFLCGDYQYVEKNKLMPYGMTAAILSGRQCAQAVQKFLLS